MNGTRLTRAASVALFALLASCSDPSGPKPIVPADPPAGSVRGTVLDATTNAGPSDTTSVKIEAYPTSNRGQARPADRYERNTGSFSFALLPAGSWTIRVSGMHHWGSIFPGLSLYADTTVIVNVAARDTTVVPEVRLRRRAPLLLIGVNSCPFPLPDPPTLDDWGNCDSGYWGGVAVRISVKGVAGSSTEAFQREVVTGPAYAPWQQPASWDDTPWSKHFDIAVPGDYDVTVVSVAPGHSGPWYLVPWQPSTKRVTVRHGLTYVGLDFWYK